MTRPCLSNAYAAPTTARARARRLAALARLTAVAYRRPDAVRPYSWFAFERAVRLALREGAPPCIR